MPNSEPVSPSENKFSASDVAQILTERAWHTGEFSAEQLRWCEQAADLLGPQSTVHRKRYQTPLDPFLSLFHDDTHS